MATRKREVGVVKEKRGSIPEREPEKRTPPPLRGTRTLNQSTKTSVSSSSQKQVPTSLIKPPTRSTATNASKQQGKKPASTDTPQKPNARTIKAVSPMQKTRVPTNAVSARSSGRPVSSQKAISGKNLKPTSKQATNASNVRKGSTGMKEEIGSGASAAKEHITCILKVEIPSVVEAEAEGQDQEECGEKREKVDDHLVVVEDQEPLDIAKKSEAEIDDTDAKVVFSELSTASGHENTVPDAKIQDSDDKSTYVQVLEENDNNSHEEAVEEDAREVEKVEKEEDETERDSSGREGNEFKETESKEVVVEKKQEPADNKGTKQVQRAHGKKDVALSNDVIEETASKLQEQRKNRVKALAGAFETVISLQDK